MKTESENMGDKLLRKKDAAEMLACSLRTIDRLVAAGRLLPVRILGGVRFRFSEVQALMKGVAA